MTYAQLRDLIDALPEEELNDTVTVYLQETDEYFGVVAHGNCEDGILDDGHLFLKIEIAD